MSRFLDQIRKAKEAREAALKRGKTERESAPVSQDAAWAEPPSGAQAAPPAPDLFPRELEQERPGALEIPKAPTAPPVRTFPDELEQGRPGALEIPKAPTAPPVRTFPDELEQGRPEALEIPAAPTEPSVRIFPDELEEERPEALEIHTEPSVRIFPDELEEDLEIHTEPSVRTFPYELEQERPGVSEGPGKPVEYPALFLEPEQLRPAVLEPLVVGPGASEAKRPALKSGEKAKKTVMNEPETSVSVLPEPPPAAAIPSPGVPPGTGAPPVSRDAVPAPPVTSRLQEKAPAVPAPPVTSRLQEKAPAAPLFPRELEEEALSSAKEAAAGKTESVLFIQPGRQAEARSPQAPHRARRSKGEIPVPGPEPDPAFINRIVRVAPRPDKRVLAFYDPRHHICEEYRLLGKNLLHTFSNGSENLRRGKVIILTSSVRNEGKTLTCMNLAFILAEDYKDRVLLLDADMRHPKLHRYLGLPPSTGFNDLLASSAPERIMTDCLVRTDTGLHLLTAQSTKNNPAPLLDSPNTTRILDLLRDHYSLIIVDTPPVLLATDSLTLGARSDGMLFLLRARKTKREQIQEARQRIARLEIRLLGYVINNVRTFLPKIWSRYYYGEY